MATYFVASGGSNTSPYDTWAKAATSLQTALSAASTDGDIVVIQYDGVPTGDAAITADTTYTFAANISLIASTNSGTSTITPTAMGDANWIGNSTTSWSIILAGAKDVYIDGLTFRVSGTGADAINLNPTDGAVRYYKNCTFWCETTAGAPAWISFVASSVSSTSNSYTSCDTCVFRFGNVGQYLRVGNNTFVHFTSCSIHASSTTPNVLFPAGLSQSATVVCDSCDWSNAGATIVGASSSGGCKYFYFTNCKMPATYSWFATQVPTNMSSHHLWVFNSGNSDSHYEFGYYNALGSVVAQTSKKATGAKFDGTNAVGWQIDTTSAATYATPFITPWIDLYHSGTTAITPSIEILRDGSATAYDNDEVWAEFSYQGTASSTKATIVDDKMALGGTPAAQTTGDLGAGDWTGEGGTAWFGKLNTTSTITPAEIGMLRARVCVGLASATVYVDPYIRT